MSSTRWSFARRSLVSAMLAWAVVWCGAVSIAAAQASVDGPLPQPLPLFPADNWWNVDVSQAPVDANSAAFIQFIGAGSRRVHPDFAGSAHDPDDPHLIWGMPYVSVPGSQPLVPVTFVDYADESDVGAPGRPPGYPIPEEAKTQPGWIEGGAPGSELDGGLDSNSGDRHMLIVDRDNKLLYELYRAHWNAARLRWEAGSGAVYSLTSNARRPEGWTSADAAGLAMLPGLVRYDEVYGSDPIRHAFRVTVRRTNGYVYPASHTAGDTAGALPMGARLRLKADVDISGYPVALRRAFQAMKTYGLIVADNGSDMYITGTSDPRWEPNMDAIVSAFHSLHADQFEVVQLGWEPPADADHDGLPDAWETQFGLSPQSSSGNDGAEGDPDGDGRTNAQEYRDGTHPTNVETYTRYFAEGASNSFFNTRFALLNPGAQAATVLFRYLRDDGQVFQSVVKIGPHTRYTENPAQSVGALGAFATTIETDHLIVADRTMWWDQRRYGATAETALPSPALEWFFAEGATSDEFQLFYLIENPGDDQVQVTVRYLLPSTPSFTLPYTLAPHSRTTIPVNGEDARLQHDEVSAVITASAPVIAERAMYRAPPGHPAMEAGHESAGVTSSATRWFLAEGATGFFSLYVLVSNAEDRAAALDVTYLLPDGSTLSRPLTVPARARRTIAVNDEEFPGVGKALASTQVATIVTSTNGVPVVVERAMWWPSAGWYEAHNSPGSTRTSLVWASAEGEAGGDFGISSYYLIANTSPFAGRARVTFMFEDGTPSSAIVELSANSRTTISGAVVSGTLDRRFGVLVESLPGEGATTPPPDLVVERAMYWDADGQFWAAGTNALLAPLASAATP